MNNNILEFIHRRFKQDCNWISENCYYFSIILKDRFPNGTILYDVISGHFLYKYEDNYYDWTGVIIPNGRLVEWVKFEEYDRLQKEIIICDCVK